MPTENENNETPETPETPEGETPETPPKAEETPAAPASSGEVQQALKALSDIQQRMASQGPTSSQENSADKIRDQIKEQTGWTDAQIDFHQQSIVGTMAPIQEELSWMKLEKSHPDLAKYKDLMQKELADGYSPAQKANPLILEKVYYLAKGRAMEQNPPSNRPEGGTPKPKVSPGYPGFTPGVDSSGRQQESVLTAEQKEYARRLGVPEDAYLRSTKTKNIKELKVA